MEIITTKSGKELLFDNTMFVYKYRDINIYGVLANDNKLDEILKIIDLIFDGDLLEYLLDKSFDYFIQYVYCVMGHGVKTICEKINTITFKRIFSHPNVTCITDVITIESKNRKLVFNATRCSRIIYEFSIDRQIVCSEEMKCRLIRSLVMNNKSSRY